MMYEKEPETPHKVFVPRNPCGDYHYEPGAQYPMYWNVASTYNDGWRATDVMWRWFQDYRIECYEWDLIAVKDPNGGVLDAGVLFAFTHLRHAQLFKIKWL